MDDDARQQRLIRLKTQADAYEGPRDFEAIGCLCRSADADERLMGILLLQESDDESASWFDLAKSMIPDEDNNCRWQAVIAVGDWLKCKQPEWVWEVIQEFGDTEDEDMRAAIGCCLLEHLLEVPHFDHYFPKVRTFAESASPHFLGTMRMCWFGAPDEWKEYLRRPKED